MTTLKLLLRLFPPLILLAAGIWITTPDQFIIQRPRVGVPAVQLAGESFEIVLKRSLPFGDNQWHARLQAEGKPDIHLTVTAQKQHGSLRHLSVKIPTDADDGAYTLVVSKLGQQNQQVKAVHIRRRFSNKVRFIHLADQEDLVGRDDRYTLLWQEVAEINLINPDFVLVSGDIAGNGRWLEFQHMKEVLAAIDAPVIIAPGNHEYRGWGGFLTTFAYPYHQVSVGNYSILSINSAHGRDQLTQSQYRWIEQQLRDNSDKINLAQMHHPVFFRRNLIGMRDELVNDFNHYQVPAVFAGHWHSDAVFNNQGERQMLSYTFPGTKYIITTAAGAGPRESDAVAPPHYGYRLVRMLGSQIRNYTYDFDGDGYRDADTSLPAGKLKITPQQWGAVTVENQLFENLERAKVTIPYPAAQPVEGVNIGEIVKAERRGEQILYQVEFDLPAGSEQEIRLQPERELGL